MRIVLILILLLFFNCSSTKNETSNSGIDVEYIREIITYSNFKNFLNRDLKRKSTVNTIAFGPYNRLGKIEVYKYYYPKQKELVYVEYMKESDSSINEKYYFKNNDLVHIVSSIVNKQKDTLSLDVFLKDNKIYFERKSEINPSKLINKGLNYITKFNFTD